MRSRFLLSFIAACVIPFSVSALCSAHITYQQSPSSTVVSFSADSISGGFLGAATFSWSFGDNTAGSGQRVTHQYNLNGVSSGTYIVCLTMTDTSAGCTFTTCDTVRISATSGSSCTTSMSYTNIDSLYTFNTSNIGVAPFASTWTLNGQTVATTTGPNGVTFVVVDSAAGFLNQVCVTVTDSTGCVSSDCAYIYNSNQGRCNTYAAFTHLDSLYTFTATHIGTLPVTYQWSYNNTLVDTTASISLVLDSAALAATAGVCVTITDANGCVSSDCITVGSNPLGGGGPCHAYFRIYPDSANGGGVGYYSGYNLSSGSYGSNILWNFGDSTTSTSPYPSHNYATPGMYIVCLTVGVAGTSCYDTYCDSSFYAFKTEGGLMSHLSFANPSGISEPVANAAIQIYPNPVNSELTITTSKKIELERVFTINGQLVIDRKASNNKIDVSKLSAGIYILELISEGSVSRTKFVKD